jgi:transposase
MDRLPYPSDLTDAQWALIERELPPPPQRGRRCTYARREIFNAILYISRSGCQGRMLPHDFPPYRSVFGYFTQWQEDGTLARLHDVLVLKVRVAAGRESEPSVGVIDSQSVKVQQKGGLPHKKGGPRPPSAATNISK